MGSACKGHIVSSGADDRTPAIHSAPGGRSVGRPAARLRANALRSDSRAGQGSTPSRMSGISNPGLDAGPRCRVRPAQFASPRKRRSAGIEPSEDGIGFVCMAPPVAQAKALTGFARAVLTLLDALSAASAPGRGWIVRDWPTTCRRCCTAAVALPGLSDAGLVKLFPAAAFGAPAAGPGEAAQHPPIQAVVPERRLPCRHPSCAPTSRHRGAASAQWSSCAAARRWASGEEELDALKHPALVSDAGQCTGIVVFGLRSTARC